MFSTAFTYMSSAVDLGPDLLLDLYPNARVAYSVRKLKKAYTGKCLRVRRSSDEAEKDISFLNGVLNETELTDFVGANNGFVVKFYDQSGNGNDAVKTTAADQPRIVNSGTIETINGKPAVRTLQGTTRQNMDLTTNFVQGQWSQYFVTKKTDGYTAAGISRRTTGVTSALGLVYATDQKMYNVYASTLPNWYVTRNTSALSNTTDPKILMAASFTSGNEGKIWQNGSLMTNIEYDGSTTDSITFNSLFLYSDGVGLQTDAFFSEVVYWNGDQSSNAVAIQNNSNSYFSIY